MTEWAKTVLEILFAFGILASLNSTVEGLDLKPESWTNRHYRGVKAADTLLNVMLLFLVVLYV